MVARRERQPTIEIEQPCLLLVEGLDDDLFFQRVIERRGSEGIQIIRFCGKDNLGNFLTNVLVPRIKSSDVVKVIGVTRDADDDYSRAFQSVGGSLSIASLPVPSAPLIFAEGTLDDAAIRVAAYIMPDNASPGELETLCLEAVHEVAAMPCVDGFFACLESIGHIPAKIDKARLGAFLSSNINDPNLRIGQAIRAGAIPWDSPAFAGIHQFLDMLTAVD
jgi:hypothetical protein